MATVTLDRVSYDKLGSLSNNKSYGRENGAWKKDLGLFCNYYFFPTFYIIHELRYKWIGRRADQWSKYREWKIYCYVFTLLLKPKIWKFHVVVWQTDYVKELY